MFHLLGYPVFTVLLVPSMKLPGAAWDMALCAVVEGDLAKIVKYAFQSRSHKSDLGIQTNVVF